VQWADITSVEGAKEVAVTAARLGDFAKLIHAAGIAPPAAPETIMAVNLLGTINVLDAFTPLVHAKTVGIVLASLAAHRRLTFEFDEMTLRPTKDPLSLSRELCERYPALSPSRLAYAVSKRGTILQVKKHSLSWGQRGGRLVSISPGIIADTEMGTQRGLNAPRASDGEHEVRRGLSSEIAAAVWLASSNDASLLNGTDLLVDGGHLAAIDTAYSSAERDNWHGLRT